MTGHVDPGLESGSKKKTFWTGIFRGVVVESRRETVVVVWGSSYGRPMGQSCSPAHDSAF